MALKGHIPWNKGISWDEETKLKIGLKSIGRKHTEDWKKAHSKKMKGILSGEKNPMFGKFKELNPNWRGGRVKRKDGYIIIRTKKNKYELQHRIIMGKCLDRELREDELVHHINGISDDNRIENLKIVTNSEHAKLHNTLGNINEQRKLNAVIQNG